ncbi:MAG: phosphotransferase [Rhodospirillales bacterium]|nr:phosphotransferase [Rhodospirillales bacterium]
MTDFYRLPLAERAERLQALATVALARWGVRDCEPEILKVRENAVFRVRTAEGDAAVLRVHRHGYHSDAALRSELAWLEALNADGIAVSAVIPSAAGAPFEIVTVAGVPEPRQVDMLTWMPGIPIGTIEEGLNPAIADVHAVFEAVGRLAARLHNQTEAWPQPSGFVRHAWDREGLVGPKPLWGRFWEAAVLGAEERRLIDRARAQVHDDLTAYGCPPRRYGLIHADLNLDNMLFDGERVVILDFDDCGFGWHLFDLSTVWTLFHGSDLAEAMRAGVIEGYRRERDLPDEELAHMPLFELGRAFSYLGWVHTRSETASAQALAQEVATLVCTLAEAYLRGG